MLKKYAWLAAYLTICFCAFSCKTESQSHNRAAAVPAVASSYAKIEGKTMGTTYHITINGGDPVLLQNRIDQLLFDINQEVSTYIDTSTISMINKSKDAWTIQDTHNRKFQNKHFRANFDAAKKIYATTEGAFDPTIMSLVNYWGFGYTPKKAVTKVDSQKIVQLLETVGFDKIHLQFIEEEKVVKIIKENSASQLDFSAIAKGYAVDAISKLLEKEGIADFFVEIGGETRVKGKNNKGQLWRIGINTPKEGASVEDIHTIVALDNKAIATSGNYRNFHQQGTQKYGHTINPKTGFPEANMTLSATVLASDCIIADAFATAFMTMGYQKALKIVASNSDLEALFIYTKTDGTMHTAVSEGMETILNKY